MKSYFLKYFYVILFIHITLLGINSCTENDPIAPIEVHFDAEGLLITESGITIASIFRGITTDTIEVPAGGRTGHYKVRFYDKNQNVIDPPSDGKTLGWEINDTSKLGVYQHPGEEGDFEFHLDGKTVGTTFIEFFILHEGHADYRSGKIPVLVKDISGSNNSPIGVILYDEEIRDTSVILNSQTSLITGSINVAVGDTTDHSEAGFFNANDIEFQPSITAHSIQVNTAGTNIAVISGMKDVEPNVFSLWCFYGFNYHFNKHFT